MSHKINIYDHLEDADEKDVMTIDKDIVRRKKKKKSLTCVPRQSKYDPCVPSLATRIKLNEHCPAETAPKKINICPVDPFKQYVYGASSSATVPDGNLTKYGIMKDRCEPCPNAKQVSYGDDSPCDINLQRYKGLIQHGACFDELVKLPSPKLSGENIRAERTVISESDRKPPLPPEKMLKDLKPHSGIIVNRNKDYLPDDAGVGGGPFRDPDLCPPQRAKKLIPCTKTRKCGQITCQRKECRKYARRKKKMMEARGRKRSKYDPCAGRGVPPPSGVVPCGLDDIPRQEYPIYPSNLRQGTIETFSLTVIPCTKDRTPQIHYGILMGTYNMYNERFGPKSRGKQALTMCIMSYCLAFHYHPKQWTMKLIDHLMTAGDGLYLQCLEKLHDHSSVAGICEVIPYNKKQVVNLNHKRMQVLLGEPEIIGYTMLADPTVINLCKGLKAFFLDHRAGVLMTRILKVMLWKDSVCYYMFDPAGRDSRAYSNFAKGSAAVVNVRDLKSLSEILLARTLLADQKFVLAPVKILKIVDEKDEDDFESEGELTQADKAKMSYRILNDHCAIVNANLHMGDRCFEDARWRQAIPIAVVVLTYAKISPPNTWYTKTLDKIMRFGNKLYLDCANPKINTDLTIDNIPNEIQIGPYCCDIIIYRERVKGQLFTTKECLFNIETGICDFFTKDYHSGILEFNTYALAIWKQKDMYYLFDPYARTPDGEKSLAGGQACVLMLLDTEAIAEAFTQNWNYLPETTQFYIHAFKVLKLRKMETGVLTCSLGDTVKRKVLPASRAGKGDGSEVANQLKTAVMFNPKTLKEKTVVDDDEEKLGDIVSLVDSVQDDFVPKTPLKYKHMPPEPIKHKVVSLDSPTVSVTQVVPPWPKPRDKSNELPEPDPDPEPPTPPTPPELPPPEGGAEEGEEEEEEDDDAKAEKKRKLEEEEAARRKALELPPALPPPPPSPQPEEPDLAPAPGKEFGIGEVQTLEPPDYVERKVLLTEDAKYRYRMRQLRKEAVKPLSEQKNKEELPPEEEFKRKTNFHSLPDSSQIIRGLSAIKEEDREVDQLPFASIMAIVMSYKYTLNTWNKDIVTAIVTGGTALHKKKKEKFTMSPAHIIPRMSVGSQLYHVSLDVVEEGPTWDMGNILNCKFFKHYNRGMLTTSHYSCAIFKKNDIYYLFDPTGCNALGLRDPKGKGVACLVRFNNLQDLVTRIRHNKRGFAEDQLFILSTVKVRTLLTEPLMKLPDDYDLDKGQAKVEGKMKPTVVTPGIEKSKRDEQKKQQEREELDAVCGYQLVGGMYRIVGSSAVETKSQGDVSVCHFACLLVMLMATMRPIKTWNHFIIDTCLEKAYEIYEKVNNFNPCDRRIIRNILLDGKMINVNIRKVIVINNNSKPTLEQYVKAVMKRVRYIIIKFEKRNFVICFANGQYHLFDPYKYPSMVREDVGCCPTNDQVCTSSSQSSTEVKDGKKSDEKKSNEKKSNEKKDDKKNTPKIITTNVEGASWTLYPTFEAMVGRLRKEVTSSINNPEFYTFELTSVKPVPKHAAFNYKLSPLFKADENPADKYTRRRPSQPPVDEKMYWLSCRTVPWSRLQCCNNAGFKRKTTSTVWKAWDIELPGDLYSLWGTRHPSDMRYSEAVRGTQYLAIYVMALALIPVTPLSAWTPSLIDGIVDEGTKYHEACVKHVGGSANTELIPENMLLTYSGSYPFAFTVKFAKVIFGYIYNMEKDKYNLSKALCYFFESSNQQGVLICPNKNLAFGKTAGSYFMFDCQTKGLPIFNPDQGAAYILKCESLNRLIHCITVTLNCKRHGQQFHLYSAVVSVSEGKEGMEGKEVKEVKEGKEGKKGKEVKKGKS